MGENAKQPSFLASYVWELLMNDWKMNHLMTYRSISLTRSNSPSEQPGCFLISWGLWSHLAKRGLSSVVPLRGNRHVDGDCFICIHWSIITAESWDPRLNFCIGSGRNRWWVAALSASTQPPQQVGGSHVRSEGEGKFPPRISESPWPFAARMSESQHTWPTVV